MKLRIENLAKIKEADIELNGITVIGGDNDTGKSTVGKVLFGIFNALNKIEEKVKTEREQTIKEACEYALNSLHTNIVYDNESKTAASRLKRYALEFELRKITLEEIKKIQGEETNSFIEEIEQIFMKYVKQLINDKEDVAEQEQLVKNAMKLIQEYFDIADNNLEQEYITRYFSRIFHNQVNSLMKEECDSIVELSIKKQVNKLTFTNNKCSGYVKNISILKKAIYIDNPFIIDDFFQEKTGGMMEKKLRALLTNDSQSDISAGLMNTLLAKEKLNEIYEAMCSVVKGDIVEERKNEYYLKNDDFSSPVSFQNLSAGLKSFVILKMLLEKGSLQQKDVLILDEPEIHLHPEWQVAYAELIVLLQKHFDLEIVITTHSPYFLDAINLFSIKHKINSRVNYYLSSMDDNQVIFEKVTDNIDAIYKKMALPTQTLDTLRYELFNN